VENEFQKSGAASFALGCIQLLSNEINEFDNKLAIHFKFKIVLEDERRTLQCQKEEIGTAR